MRTDASAKIILLGEHAVVHYQPAIAIPVSNLRATAAAQPTKPGSGLRIIFQDLDYTAPVNIETDPIDNALTAPAQILLNKSQLSVPDLDILVHSDIPVASGLGSGAAISAVIVRALAHALNLSISTVEVNDIVYQVEKLHHGNPSGVDNTVIVYEQPVYFVRGQPIEFLKFEGEYNFLIADTGISAPTHLAVEDVDLLYQKQTERFKQVFNKMGQLVFKARHALAVSDYAQVGALMTQNHLYLQELTVSSPALDYLVETALQAGALGAKLSGGGRGGNMIALVDANQAQNIGEALYHAGAIRVTNTLLR